MYIKKNFGLKGVMRFTGHHFVWLFPLMTTISYIEFYTEIGFFRIPWQPIAVVGTAVAFYIGFKNNQAYDRVWEARKVWGAIVNSSRAWGSYVTGFITDQFTPGEVSDEEIKDIHQKMIYRHIAWLYALRHQLLIPTPWEHISQNGLVARFARKNRKIYGIDMFEENITIGELDTLLDTAEAKRMCKVKNAATQLIQQQSEDLKALRRKGFIEDFRHMELEKILYDFYIHQGKLERIKKFPIPRQYGYMSFVFVGIFIAILPLGLTPLFSELGTAGFVASIVANVLVSWVYITMELVGDYSENPFEGTGNDIPMLSLCRTIEIDLREMLNEKDLPKPIEAINNVLM